MKIKNLKSKLVPHWPVLTFAVTVLILFIANFRIGTYLTGWDNLHPEFYPLMNIKRSLFAVWQEYQSLGLLGGMGHASDLVHQVFLLLLSFIFPDSALRYLWVFLMLFVGAFGAYEFTKYIFQRENRHKTEEKELSQNSHIKTFAFFGGFFYLLNLATIQTFFAPFEAFIAHFGALPWLLVASVKFFETPTRRNHIFLILVLFLATPAAYIPTLFVTYLLALSILVGVMFFKNKNRKSFITAFKLYLTIFVVNAFWLLPFIYFTLTNSSVNLTSKINQMATETIFLQNKEFGNFVDVALLRGFWFNNVDPNIKGDFVFMLGDWRAWNMNPVLLLVGFMLFGIVVLGAIKNRSKLMLPFVVLFIFSFGVLAIDTFPFSIINTLIRDNIKILHQAFRFPFTKFAVLAALMYAVFFAFGVRTLAEILTHRVKNFTLKRKQILFGICALLVVLNVLPAFGGKLLYGKDRLVMPQEYFSVFEYFKTQNPNTRIANFPQHTFWGWEFYSWGYGGSGFLWYGIRQPILDRAFDVWSKTAENYYFELSHAMYSKDTKQFEAVLQKYQVGFLLVDKHVINPFAPKALFYEDLKNMIARTETIKLAKSFGKIDIYTVTLKDKPQDFLFGTSTLPRVNEYNWAYDDHAYNTLGNYIASTDTTNYFYPYRSLFSQKTQVENTVQATESKDTITLNTTLPEIKSARLPIKPYVTTEKIVPVILEKTLDQEGNTTISMKIQTPEVTIGGKKIWGESITHPLFIINTPITGFGLTLTVNGVSNFQVLPSSNTIGTTFLSLTQDNIFNLSSKNQEVSETQTITAASLVSLPIFIEKDITVSNINKGTQMTVKIPKIVDGHLGFNSPPSSIESVENCDRFRNGTTTGNVTTGNNQFGITLTSTNATACTATYFSTLPHDLSYLVFVDGKHDAGRTLHMWILNEDAKYAPVDTYISKTNSDYHDTFVVPPLENFGRAYSFHFDSISIGKGETKNSLTRLALYPIPYNFLTSLTFIESEKTENAVSSEFKTMHPNESLYIIDSIKKLPDTLVLSQSFDTGWHAYHIKQADNSGLNTLLTRVFPFFVGKELTNHVEVNNWQNGWILGENKKEMENEQSKIVIVYVPQYLQYIGFLLLFFLVDVTVSPFRKINSYLEKKINESRTAKTQE